MPKASCCRQTIGAALSSLSKKAFVDAVIKGLRGAQKTVIAGMRSAASGLPAWAKKPAGTLIGLVEGVADVVITAILAALGIVMGFASGIADMVVGLLQTAWTILVSLAPEEHRNLTSQPRSQKMAVEHEVA